MQPTAQPAGLLATAAGAPQPPMDPMAGEQGADGLETLEESPEFDAAVEFMQAALYENEAARDIATALKSAPDRVTGLAEQAYKITQIVDERTDGTVPEDHLALLGMTALQECAEIGDAAGLAYTATEIAEAFKQMMLMYMRDNGIDTTQIEQGLSSVDPAVFEKLQTEEV